MFTWESGQSCLSSAYTVILILIFEDNIDNKHPSFYDSANSGISDSTGSGVPGRSGSFGALAFLNQITQW